LKLYYDKLLSTFGFNFNFRRCTKGRIEVNGRTNDTGLVPHMAWNGTVQGSASINTESDENTLPALGGVDLEIQVRRCRLTLSNSR